MERVEKIKQTPLKVILIGHTTDPEQVVAAAIRQCYSPIGAADLLEKISEAKRSTLIRQVISSGHHSTVEHAYFNFAVEGISRAASHQLVRHRMASYSQQSQRYVEFSDKKPFPIIEPPSVKRDLLLHGKFTEAVEKAIEAYHELVSMGVPAEDARFLLPNATETKIVVSMNSRALFNFFEVRLCRRAQWEIRKMAALMRSEVMKVAPGIFRYTGPTCKTERICWEGKLACGIPSRVPEIEIRDRFAGIE